MCIDRYVLYEYLLGIDDDVGLQNATRQSSIDFAISPPPPSVPTPTSHHGASYYHLYLPSGPFTAYQSRNLHWKPTTRTSLRTIQELDVELVELGDVPTGGRSALGSVLEQPLVNLCVVVCEVGHTRRSLRKVADG
jgi:hypothetical protein